MTGPSRIRCTGCWTSVSARTSNAIGLETARKICPGCAKLALCLLKAVKNSKGKSIHRRRLLAGWKNEFLLSVLAQIPEKSDA